MLLKRLAPLMILFAPFSGLLAHHSQGSYYDTSMFIELEGIITEARWQNPHMRFKISAVDENGQEVLWDIETTSLSLIRQIGMKPGFVKEGDRIKMAGYPARRSSTGMYVVNLLAPDGNEYMLSGATEPRWTTPAEISRADQANASAEVIADDAGLFRTWSTVMGPGSNRLWNDEYPLTEWARTGAASWNPAVDNPALRCEPKGMPTIMDPPYPIELVDLGDTILFKQEEFDTVRTIYMGESHADRDLDPSVYGHSVGRWDGDTLVVETIRVNWPFFDNDGVPQGDDAHFTERFSVSEDDTQLDYTITTIDSQAFTETVTLDRTWIWRPDVNIQPFNCTL